MVNATETKGEAMTDEEIQDREEFFSCANNVYELLEAAGTIWRSADGHWEATDEHGQRMGDEIWSVLVVPLALPQARCELDSKGLL